MKMPKRETTSAIAGRAIEHIETIAASDIPRFGKLGVTPACSRFHSYRNPNTLDVWGAMPARIALLALGMESISDGGGRLAFGSDWPVLTLNPWEGIQSASYAPDV